MDKVQRIVLAALAVLVLILGGSNIYIYRKYSKLQENPQKVAQETVDKLVAQVSNFILLPQNETPTVATVTDPSKLKDQPFFTNAKEGYKVLIYTNARKAIMFDPINNKIIEVAPITIGNNQTVPTQPSTPEVKPAEKPVEKP